MISRTRFIITAALVCHLLLAPRLVTSQLRSDPNADTAAEQNPSAPPTVLQRMEEVRIQAIEQQQDGPIYKLRGHAEIRYGSYSLHADEATSKSYTGESSVEGRTGVDRRT